MGLAVNEQISSDARELVLNKINSDTLFTGTFLNEVVDLLKNKPEELGGDFQSDAGKKLLELAVQIVKNNIASKTTDETKVPASYLDCGKDSATKDCLIKAATNCSLAKGIISDSSSGLSMEHMIDGFQNGKCLYEGSILSGSYGLSGLKINCSLSNEQVAKIFSTGIQDLSNCSGSYVDFANKQSH